MLKLNLHSILMVSIIGSVVMLQGCGNENSEQKKVEIKAAPKLTNDATTYANAAWELINKVDHFVYENKTDVLEEEVRKPTRKLSTDWRINVKMTDSVTEGKYALCRKALTSLEIWARESIEKSSSVDQKKADYERDKSQCKGAIDNPNLGNTDPKKIGV
jgi:hypothetical protein